MTQRAFGLIQDEKDERDYSIKPLLLQENSYLENNWPDKIDYSNEMTKVKNQGKLGSCVAFAVNSVREWQEWKEHTKEIQEGKNDHREGKPYDLSEMWLYWNCKKIDPWPNSEGTSIRAAMKVLKNIGVPPEHAWKYKDTKTPKGEPKSWSTMIARWNQIGSDYRRITKWQDLKRTLANHGPVIAGILCYSGIYYPNEWGVIPMPKKNEKALGGHAIAICGYDDKRRQLIFKNSWGQRWGYKGYGVLNYDYFHEGHMLDIWYPNDIKVTKDMLKG